MNASQQLRASRLVLSVLATLLLVVAASPLSAATIILNNVDPPGQGFNDPSPPSLPAPGNSGTTLGEQRVIVMQRALDIWAEKLISNVPIVVQATFVPGFWPSPPGTGSLPCTPTGATLAAAGAIQLFANFANAPVPGTWYHVGLANKLAGVDLAPGPPDPSLLVAPFADDSIVFANNLVDDLPSCLGGAGFYYGLDHNEGTAIDLLATLTHEVGHSLGFSNFVNEQTGAFAGPPFLPDIYTVFTLDLSNGLHWDQMTNAQRVASAINDPNVVWDGPNVTAEIPNILGSPGQLTVNPPAASAGNYAAQKAAFGPLTPQTGLTADIVLADDGVGVATDGCEGQGTTPPGAPWVNGAAVSGKIALIDRGACSFVQKVLNAQAEGAIGVVVANNVATGLPPMGGNDPTVTIPSCGVAQATGNAIKADLLSGAVSVTKGFDTTTFAGTNGGFLRVNAPNPLQLGSSISHWTPDASCPNLLMEPAVSGDLTDDLDMTIPHFKDIGWMIAECGNNVIENNEVCDGTDLGGATCASLGLGFTGGTLGCNDSCSAFNTANCFTCQSGRASGRWNLPVLTNVGSFGGVLTNSAGVGVYRIFGSIVETAPGKGIFAGPLYDGSNPNPFYVVGEWKITSSSGTIRKGVFESKIFEFGTGVAVGQIEGEFKDDVSFTNIGTFGPGRWEICQ